MNGVIPIFKEQGYTSFDVVAVVRRILSERKVGHTGTLDPNATGVLPVLVGSATKAQDVIPNHDKQYRASFRLGIATDTLDIWGEVIRQMPFDVTREKLASTLGQFRGEISQLPPMYSAVSVDGKRLYQYAREGKSVERRARKVTVYELELIRFDEQKGEGELAVSCSRGTYIRTLIDDIAQALGTCGVMTGLVRTAACGFTLDDAVTLDELCALALSEKIPLLPVESLFERYAPLEVTDKQAARFHNGNPLDLTRTRLRADVRDGEILRVKAPDGAFVSLGIVDLTAGVLKLYKHF